MFLVFWIKRGKGADESKRCKTDGEVKVVIEEFISKGASASAIEIWRKLEFKRETVIMLSEGKEYLEEFLKKPLESFRHNKDFPQKAIWCLKSVDILTIGDLINSDICERDFLKINNFGIKSLEKLKIFLKKYHLKLRNVPM